MKKLILLLSFVFLLGNLSVIAMVDHKKPVKKIPHSTENPIAKMPVKKKEINEFVNI